MAGNSCRFGLNSLGTTYFQPFRCSIGIKCHILCLKWCRMIAILTENTAESRGNNAFTYITTGTDKHNRMKFLHKKMFFREGKDNANRVQNFHACMKKLC